MTCNHENFTAKVDVHRLEDSGRFSADVSIKCVQCGTPFSFLGLPAGLDLNGASVSVDGTEARLAIGTPETVANIMDGNDPVGFTVRREFKEMPLRRCAVVDAEYHHCPETPLHEIERNGTRLLLCEKCHQNYITGAYGDL